MSVLATVGTMLIDNNSDNPVGFIMIGPAMWFTLGSCALIRKIDAIRKDCNLRAIMSDNNGNYFYCKSRDAKWFDNCTDAHYKFITFDRSKFNPLDWDKEYQIMGVGNQRYSPRKVWSKFMPIPKNELEYAKKHQFKDDEN